MNEIVTWLAITGLGLGGSLILWLMNRTVTRLDSDQQRQDDRLSDHDKQHTHCSLELANFKTEVANNYAKDATMQQSLGRLHDRIDSVAADIKEILLKVK